MSDVSLGPFTLVDEAATIEMGQALAALVERGRCIYMVGPLGAGKTTLVRAMLRKLGHAGAVRSPTYNLMEHYQFARLSVVHLDLYRLGDPEEVEYLGLREMLDDSCMVVEWPERGLGFLPPPDVIVQLGYDKRGRKAQWGVASELVADLEPKFRKIT